MSLGKVKSHHLANLITGLSCQVLIALAGFVLQGLIIRTYGSALNGLVATITQMMTYLALVEAGLASAALVSLFKPMAEEDYDTASSMMAAINKFYIKVANVFLGGSVVCGIIAIVITKDDIPRMTIWLVTFSVAISSYVSFRLLNKYKVLFQSDNRIYIVNIIHFIGVSIQFICSVLFIHQRLDISSTKAIVIISNLVEWSLLLYCKQRLYPLINFKVSPKLDAIKQRKDILAHQIVSLILNNTDAVLLGIFSASMSTVSIYNLYAMVGTLLQHVLNCFLSMFNAKMGQKYSIGDYADVQNILKKYEVIYNIVLYSLYCCMAILILPFICVYTKGVDDADYYSPIVGMLFSIYGITRMLRLPYSELIVGAGHFKETKIQAIIEASTNLIVSIVLLPFMGIPGVLIGSIIGEVYRTIHTYYYCEKKLLKIEWGRSIILSMANCGAIALLIKLFKSFRYSVIDTYIDFIKMGLVVSICVFAVVLAVNCLTVIVYNRVRIIRSR